MWCGWNRSSWRRASRHLRHEAVVAEKNGPVWGQFLFLVCCLLVATALLARNHTAIAPVDRSRHRAAVLPWANGHAAWANADGGVIAPTIPVVEETQRRSRLETSGFYLAWMHY
jgi:hypothetical protein